MVQKKKIREFYRMVTDSMHIADRDYNHSTSMNDAQYYAGLYDGLNTAKRYFRGLNRK